MPLPPTLKKPRLVAAPIVVAKFDYDPEREEVLPCHPGCQDFACSPSHSLHAPFPLFVLIFELFFQVSLLNHKAIAAYIYNKDNGMALCPAFGSTGNYIAEFYVSTKSAPCPL